MSQFRVSTVNTTTATATTAVPEGGLKLPSYATGSMPASPSAGQIVYNTTKGISQVYTGSAWEDMGGALETLPTWTTGNQPTGANAVVGSIGYNTSTNDLEIYDGTNWAALPASRTIVDLLDSDNFNTLRNYFQARLSNYKNTSYYDYTLDDSPGRLSDGGRDQYDGGNQISLYSNGSDVAGSGNLNYNTANDTADSNQLRWGGLGYDRPLFCIATSGLTQKRYGWYSGGDLGADGDGNTDANTVNSNGTHYGCVVHSWLVNKAWNGRGGDPSVNHFYFTLGHSSLGSSIASIDVQDYAGDTNSDYSRYESTSTNCIVGRVLMTRNTDARVTTSEAETVMSTIATDFKAALGL